MQTKVSSAEVQQNQQYQRNQMEGNQLLKQTQITKLLTSEEDSKTSNQCLLSSDLKEQLKSVIETYIGRFQEQLREIKKSIQKDRSNTLQNAHEISLLKIGMASINQSNTSKIQSNLKRTPSTNSNSNVKILNLQSQIMLLSSRFEQLKPNSIQNTQIQKQCISQQISKIKNQLKLEIAHVKDEVLDIQDHFKVEIDKLQLSNNLFFNTFQQNIDDFIQKNRIFTQTLEKHSSEIEKHNRQFESSLLRIDKIQKNIKQIDNDFDQRVEDSRIILENRFVQAEELFQTSLQKVIVPYNSNFQEMDRNIAQLKEIIKDVLKFNKALGDKLATRLNNTIDANTFQKTIQNLNESFSQTYLLNTQKIKQLNQKQYQVYHQLNYVKDVIENLKVDFKSSKKTLDINPFEKKITSLGDLGIDSDSDQLKEELTQETDFNPFRRSIERPIEQTFY